MDVFLVEDDDLLEKYNTISSKVSADIKKEFNSEPFYKKEFLKTKKNLMVIKLQIFMINKFLRWALVIIV